MSNNLLVTNAAAAVAAEKFAGKQLHHLLFPEQDKSLSAGLTLDDLTDDTTAITYREKDMQSGVISYTPGVGNTIDVPRSSMKTPVTEKLRDAVCAGTNIGVEFGENEKHHTKRIISKHTAAHTMTKNKQSIDTFLTGIFPARGEKGASLGLDIDYSRLVGLSFAYDFTVVGASFSKAAAEILEGLQDNNTPMSNLVMFCGKSWLKEMAKDEDIKDAQKNNDANILAESKLVVDKLQDTDGTSRLLSFRALDMPNLITVASYSPTVPYRQANLPSTKLAYIPDDACFMVSLDDVRYLAMRGVDVLNLTGKVDRAVGELIIDSFSKTEPVSTFLRTSTRHAMVPAQINHTASSVGTFE